MADITMCNWKDCPLKDMCHRYKATSGQLQSYFLDEPYNPVKEDCDMYRPEKEQPLFPIE